MKSRNLFWTYLVLTSDVIRFASINEVVKNIIPSTHYYKSPQLRFFIKLAAMTMRQQPCPYRIIDDIGGGFSMGCAAGCILYFIRGMWLSPKSQRFYGGVMLLKKRAPILGGSFGLWAGLFSISNCALISIRNKQDTINQIIAGGVTGGLLAFRSGRRIAFKNAVMGSLFLAAIGVVEIGMIKYQRREQLQMQNEAYERQVKMRRKEFAKMRPDMFTPTGQIIVNTPGSRAAIM